MIGISLIIGVIAILVVLYVIYIFNSLIVLNNRVGNSLATIDVQLRRRYDLIPNLVASVKGYMKHEKGTLEQITKARSALIGGSLQAKAKADNTISSALKSIFAVAEQYPNLKANENFLQLQEQLSETEEKIAFARQFYNDIVLRFNNKLLQFPTNMVGSWLHFSEKGFFTASAKERENVKVEF